MNARFFRKLSAPVIHLLKNRGLPFTPGFNTHAKPTVSVPGMQGSDSTHFMLTLPSQSDNVVWRKRGILYDPCLPLLSSKEKFVDGEFLANGIPEGKEVVIDCDASAYTRAKIASVGGLARINDNNAQLVFWYAFRLCKYEAGKQKVSLFELKAIRHILEATVFHDYCTLPCILRNDSENAISYCNEDNPGKVRVKEYREEVEQIFELKKKFTKGLKFVRAVKCKSTGKAVPSVDFLAKFPNEYELGFFEAMKAALIEETESFPLTL